MTRATLLCLLLLGLGSRSAVAAPNLAANVRYQNKVGLTSPTGKSVKNVQEALDALGTPAAKLIAGTSLKPTTWSGNIFDVLTPTLRASSVSVTFHPRDGANGTWESSPYDVFNPGDELENPSNPDLPWAEKGTWTGNYHIIGDRIYLDGIVSPSGVSESRGLVAIISSARGKLQITETRYDPASTAILSKEK
jgi:hypothetical protein